VVLLDLRMPEMDGAAVLRYVEATPDLASYHAFILVTATYRLVPRMLADIPRYLHIPILRKPFDLDDLLATVRRMDKRLHDVEPGSLPTTDAYG
jgi:CheY-like chemotaxis protein